MSKKYGVLSPSTGGYDFFSEKAEALTSAAEVAFNFYLAHTHSNFLVAVETDENGLETWTGTDGTNMPSPAEIEAQLEAIRAHMQSFVEAAQMPVTQL